MRAISRLLEPWRGSDPDASDLVGELAELQTIIASFPDRIPSAIRHFHRLPELRGDLDFVRAGLGVALGLEAEVPPGPAEAALAHFMGSLGPRDAEQLLASERAFCSLEQHERRALEPVFLAALRRRGVSRRSAHGGPAIVLDRGRRAILADGLHVDFGSSPRLFELFSCVATRGHALDRVGLYEAVWNEPHRGSSSDNRLYVAVRRIRERLVTEDVRLIRHPGGGYALAPVPVLYTLDEACPEVEHHATVATTEPAGLALATEEGPALLIAWYGADPDLLGAGFFPFSGDPGPWHVVGRGASRDDDPHRRLDPSFQRPGALVFEGSSPLATTRISRRQLHIRAKGELLEVVNVGRRQIQVNGAEFTAGILQPADVVRVGDALLLLVVQRPGVQPGADLARGAFGTPDALGLVGESFGAWRLREALARSPANRPLALVGGSTRQRFFLAKALCGAGRWIHVNAEEPGSRQRLRSLAPQVTCWIEHAEALSPTERANVLAGPARVILGLAEEPSFAIHTVRVPSWVERLEDIPLVLGRDASLEDVHRALRDPCDALSPFSTS